MVIRAYIRVSTEHQEKDRQKETLEQHYDIDDWYADIYTGTKTIGRAQFHDLLNDVQRGDKLVVTSVSRLGRSVQDVVNTVEDLKEDGVTTVIHKRSMELVPEDHPEYDPMVEGYYKMMAVFAELEVELIRERTNEKLNLLEQQGKWSGGRIPTGYRVDDDGFLVRDVDEYERLRRCIEEIQTGNQKKTTAEKYGFKRPTINSVIDNINDDSNGYYPDLKFDQEQWKINKATSE